MVLDFFPSPPPLTPPHSEEDWLDWLRLLRSRRVGVSTFFRLMTEAGNARDALQKLPEIAKAAGVGDYAACPVEVARDELRRGRLAGARLIAYGTDDYPAQLSDISDPPPLLWALGDLSLLKRPTVAMVGARNASSLGLRMARSLASGLGRAGVVTVSGLARGIDTACHETTLETGTIAVMAGGIDVVYPSENAVLAREIEERGLIVSEQPVGLRPQARHFPRRNRIISGLARGVVVVEAASKSGSLITARDSLDQGRDVLAVPGHPFDARAAGCNMLLRDGATLVRGPKDVIEALGLAEPEQAAPAPVQQAAPQDAGSASPERTLRETNALHQQILDRLGPSPTSEDQLIRDLKQPVQRVTAEIVTLELEGKVVRQPGGKLSLI
ncbi:DNA-protecting protein DprA [Maribius pontilimi]|uniref:DNA-protecting protein DprA n=1 Tax=Palleronia pontilimi TaxID=1964209 RepID=A0A934IEQ2_9RHOB|nr:DNA-processing protein DprA [Palleronia pontilimi]MBJ3761240.1 DNA-protecting protein DprA [Palleronia pontilimi]